MRASERSRAEALASALDAAHDTPARQQPGDAGDDLADLLALARRLQHEMPDLPAAEETLPEPSTAFQRRLRAQLTGAVAPAGHSLHRGGPWRRPFLAAAAAVTALLVALAGINTGLGGWMPGALQHASSTTTPGTITTPSAALLRTITADHAQATHRPGSSMPSSATLPAPLARTTPPTRPPAAPMAKTTHPAPTPDGSSASSAAASSRPAPARTLPTPPTTPPVPAGPAMAGNSPPSTLPSPLARCPTATASPTTVTGKGRPPPPTTTPTALPSLPRSATAQRRPPCLPP